MLEMPNSEMSKAWFNDPVKIAARAAKREARVSARGGRLIQRHVTAPIKTNINATVDHSVARIQRAGDRAANQVTARANVATANAEDAGTRMIRRGAMGMAAGTAAGLGGGLTLGEIGRQETQRRYAKKRKGQLYVVRDQKAALRKADSDYPYLPSTIRSDVQLGIPDGRGNPISPMQMLAASGVVAQGYSQVRSKWPFGRKKRRAEGMYRIGMGTTMGVQPLGIGVIR